MRKLSFTQTLLLIFQKSIKSIQIRLNEYILDMRLPYTISNSSFCQARKKLKHTAFKELNDGIVSMCYEDSMKKRYKGYRLLGVDASKVILPDTDDIKKAFGKTDISMGPNMPKREYASLLFEGCYDVLNHICIYSEIHPANTYEVKAAQSLLKKNPRCQDKDIYIFDRGYVSYEFIAHLQSEGLPFVIRLSKGVFAVSRLMFEGEGQDSQWVDLNLPKNKKYKNMKLPASLKVRFVRVILNTGEVEIVATSLTEEEFRACEFKELYHFRWGVESFFLKVKERLSLENFTGKTAEAVRQDFWATIFLTNLESILTEDTDKKLEEKPTKNKQTVNSSVSYNLIKNSAFTLLTQEEPIDVILEKLTQLFLTNPLQVRPKRHSLRKKISETFSLNYQKRRKKAVF
jgi:hypothetical protein